MLRQDVEPQKASVQCCNRIVGHGKKKDSIKKDDSVSGGAPRHTYLGKDIRNDILHQGTHDLGTKFKILVTLFQIIMSFTTSSILDWPSKFMESSQCDCYVS